MLPGALAERLEQLLVAKTAELDLDILQLAIQPDHLHLFVAAPPVFSPAQLVFRLNGATARLLRQVFAHLRPMPSLWTPSYLASTARNVAAETIERFIQAQRTRA